MTNILRWSYPTTIWFGENSITELPDACNNLQVQRPLLVTDTALAALPIVTNVLAILTKQGYQPIVFSDVQSNPNEQHLYAGIQAYRAGNHDAVIALGGGSALDLGKAIAFMQAQTRSVWDFEDKDDWWKRANNNGIAPIIAIPTTAGTGSEVGRAFVLTNTQTNVKKIIFHPQVLPSIVIADPQLSTGMPAQITAGTGMDAFAHCLEAFCSPHYHPMSQGIAIEGIRLVQENLERAFHNPQDIQARSHMMSAAMMGAVAFQKGLGAIHALSHPIGAHFGTHHGTTNAICMVPVLQYNQSTIESKIEKLSAYLGVSGGFQGFCSYISALNNTLNIPSNLRAIGVHNPDFNTLADEALLDPSLASNPRSFTKEDIIYLYQKIY